MSSFSFSILLLIFNVSYLPPDLVFEPLFILLFNLAISMFLLKLSTSFNQKFILNYFNESQELYSKTFNNYADTFYVIEQYFVESTFNTNDFKKKKFG